MNRFFTLLKKFFPGLVLLLLIIIPLYPKIPLINVQNTWVYVRIEDFAVLYVLFVWLVLLFKKEVTIKTPLTITILLFWIVGAVAMIDGIVLIFVTFDIVFLD